ncbi:MAG: cyanophycin synthetase, partial [Planctomycetota bacterium]
KALQKILSQVIAGAKELKNEKFGRFELSVALAIKYFQEQKAEIGVIEVGIGGRFDSTRIFRGPVTVLTSLDLEHTDLLGSTKEAIGYEKLDLADPNSKVVLGNLPAELIPKLKAYGKLNNLHLRSVMEIVDGKILSESATKLICSFEHSDFHLPEVTIPLGGHFQQINLQMALLASFLYLQNRNRWPGEAKFSSMVTEGLAHLRWEGRFQQVTTDPVIFIDAGHTGEAMKCLRETVRQTMPHQRILLLLGISFNKNKSAILDEILPVAQEIICTQALHHGEKVELLEPMIRKSVSEVPLFCIPDVREALVFAKEKACAQGMTILVAGSLFLSIEVVTLLRGQDPKELRFL